MKAQIGTSLVPVFLKSYQKLLTSFSIAVVCCESSLKHFTKTKSLTGS